MLLSSEAPRTRWLILTSVWLALSALVFVHAKTVRDYLDIVGALGLRGAAAPATPMKQAYPAFAADAQTWVRHALSLAEGEQRRLRHTRIDNAPDGREVHWNTAWGWLIAMAGGLEHWVSGAPMPEAIEKMTLWVNAFVLVVLTILISAWVTRRAGALPGVVAAIALIGHPRIYEGFFPSYVDHHGILTMAVVAMSLGSLFMGAGWWKAAPEGSWRLMPVSPEIARQAAVFSALSGACGMWVSAASVIPPIAIVGGVGLATVFLFGNNARREGADFDGDVWRVWGRVGAAASFGFYLVEYFPNHLGLRLEANHPFYSLAWLGGGEIIAQVGECWLRRDTGGRKRNRHLALALAAVAVAPLTIAIGGTRVFVVVDPFLSQLHKVHIQEFLPLWVAIRSMGWKAVSTIVGLENLPLLVGLGLLLIHRGRLQLLLGFATVGSLVFTGIAWLQSRWLLNASGFQVGLALVLVVYFTLDLRTRWRWVLGVASASLVFLPYAVDRITSGRGDVTSRRVSQKDANAALFRDIAQVIRASQPEGEVVLLTSPNSSTGVGYYGRFKTLGTLYWENNAGLKAAASVLSAWSPKEAAELVRKFRITHIAMISEENFVEPYFRLFRPEAKPDDVKRCFGYQLLVDRVIPPWLQMIPYNPPDDLKGLNVSALLFKVAFNQTPADALYHIGLAKIAMGNLLEAEQDFDLLIKGSPDSYQPYLRKGELLFARREWAAAVDFTLAGIQRAPAEARLNMYANAGSTLFRSRQHALAVRVYDAALAGGFNAEIASFLAYVLAASADDAVRNGARALALAEQAVKVEPTSPTVLNSLAVALAELGRFPEAAAAAERALGNARALRQNDAIRVSEARLTAFRAGKRWRE
jgi:tetratricopeptide (TPR) repeat protein